MPTPGGIPKRGDVICNSTVAGTRFRITDRTSSTYPMIITIVREDGKEFPPQFNRSKFNEDGSYPIMLETANMFSVAGWRYVDPEFVPGQPTTAPVQPAPGPRPTYTLEVQRDSETFEFQPQRRIPAIPSRAAWADYMGSFQTPDAAFAVTGRTQQAFNETVEWRVVLKRTTVEVVHRTS
jgi:hypothetical protein